jgi:uncharacterized protein YndB with AHSA1/START domain
MEAIRHRVGIEAPTGTVYDAIATPEGVASWWTRHVEGDGALGGKLEFWFGGDQPGATAEVTELDQGRRVEWRVIDGPAEWIGTTITFDLRDVDDETVVMFTHAGWREPVEFMHHCSTRWGYFLLSLRAGLQGGASTPWPDDDKF